MFEYLFAHPKILFVLIVWTLIWKGLALWRTAREGKKKWFVVFLIINTFGLLEIFYIYALPRFRSSPKEISETEEKTLPVEAGAKGK